MKPAPFEYLRPVSLDDAIRALAESDGEAKVLAGGQSLVPAMNLRLAQPARLVDIRAIAGLHGVEIGPAAVRYGSCVTHAAIEDGRVPDATCGLMREVAGAVAYRAVRTRGTVGGSLCHADPAADWVTVLMLLDATVVIEGPQGTRELPVEAFVVAPYGTLLGDADIVTAIVVPRLGAGARWAYRKFCRKPGEFAEAMAGVLIDGARGVRRAVLGALGGPPHLVSEAAFLEGGFDADGARTAVEAADPAAGRYQHRVRFAMLERAARAAWEIR